MNSRVLHDLRYLRAKVGKRSENCLALALVASEMYFRGQLDRVVEYCLWVALWVIRSKRVAALTIGIAQVSVGQWKQLGFFDSHAPSLQNFRTVTVVKNNYSACVRICALHGLQASSPVPEIAAAYTGAARSYYCSLLRESLLTCRRLAANAAYTANRKGAAS
jgi:hypothetical protein